MALAQSTVGYAASQRCQDPALKRLAGCLRYLDTLRYSILLLSTLAILVNRLPNTFRICGVRLPARLAKLRLTVFAATRRQVGYAYYLHWHGWVWLLRQAREQSPTRPTTEKSYIISTQ